VLNIQKLTAPTLGNPLKVDLGNNKTATITRVDNKHGAVFNISIDKNGELLFESNRRGVGAWESIKDDLYINIDK